MHNFPLPYDNTQVTIELRELVKSGVNVWDFDYPTYYNGAEKLAFEQKVLDHYWLRQIGQETAGRWLHCFRTRIREIMPYYIQLYKSQELMDSIADPFGNVDITETFEQTTTGETSGTMNSTNTGSSSSETSGNSSGSETETGTHTQDHERKFSNTPQGNIDNLDNYLTEATKETADDKDTLSKQHQAETTASSTGTATDTHNGSTHGTENSTVRHTFTKKGNQGVNTYAHDMKELRETFLNIDLMIINELKDLFLQVY